VKCVAFLILIAYVIILAFGKKMFAPTNRFWRSINLFSKAGVFLSKKASKAIDKFSCKGYNKTIT